MKTKRFTTTIVKFYRKSSSTNQISFDTIEEAKEHVNNERKIHPRSKKVNRRVVDTVENKTYFF